jgi:hypothetical protein
MLEIAKYIKIHTCIYNIYFYIPMHTIICIPHMHVLDWDQPKLKQTALLVRPRASTPNDW